MNSNFLDQELYKEYETLFKDKPEAWDFIKLSNYYFECVDDCVDEEKDIKRLRKLTAYAGMFYNHSYWLKYGQTLYPIERLIHCQYFDSVDWESSAEPWKKRDSKALSHPSVNLVFAVILIEFGQDKLDEFSSKFREHAHRLHLKDIEL